MKVAEMCALNSTDTQFTKDRHLITAFPKLWVEKFCQKGLQSFIFTSFICKMHKNAVCLLPLFSEFSVELQSSLTFSHHVVISPSPTLRELHSLPHASQRKIMSKCASQFSEYIYVSSLVYTFFIFSIQTISTI